MSRARSSELAPARTQAAVPPAAVLGLSFTPLLAAFFINLWKQPEYQFFPQALAGAAFLAWERLSEAPRPGAPWPAAPANLLLLACLGLFAFAVLIWSPWLGMVTALATMGAVFGGIGGTSLLRAMFPALMMVAVIIPPPLGLGVRLGLFLRQAATALSSRALDLLGVIHAVDGNVIEIPGRKLLVEEACSGINSVMFVMAFSLFYLFWRRRGLAAFVVCIPAALAFVVMGNVVRISLGAWLMSSSGFDILTGWKHELLSILLVIAYMVLVISLESVLPSSGAAPAREAAPRPQFSSKIWRPATPSAWVLSLLFAAVGAFSAVKAAAKFREGAEPLRAAKDTELGQETFSIPERLGGWSRSGAGPAARGRIETLGLSSLIWNFERGGMRAVVAFDYPIWSYHDVTECYTGTGWTVERKELVVPPGGAPPRFVLDLKKDPSTHATLWFATINKRGQWVDQSSLARNLLTRLGLMGLREETTFRVQVLVAGPNPPDMAARAAASELFDGAADALRRQIMALAKP